MPRISSIILAAFLLFPFFSNAQSASYGVTFGQPQDYNGPCVGKGVCKESFDRNASGMYPSNPEAITVTFQLSQTDQNVLMMSFSLSELQLKQNDQVANFVNNSSYNFDAAYSLNNDALSTLGLPSGSQITPSCNNNVQISGDFVTVSYVYAHN